MKQTASDLNHGWLTIHSFASRIPSDPCRKEQKPDTMEPESRENQNIHVLARAKLESRPKGTRIFLRISADDYYKLYVNGQFVGQGPAPAYPMHYYYNVIELTPYLQTGEAVLGVHLYYQGLKNRVWNSGDGRLALWTKLTNEMGEWAGGLSWNYKLSKAYSGEPIGPFLTQFSENFDSRRWEAGWNLPGFCEDGWKPMAAAPWARYQLSPQPTKPLSIYFEKPDIMERRDGGWFLDIGREVTGALWLKATGDAGSRLLIRCGEECDPDGQVRYEMRCNCRYEEAWTLSGGICELDPYDYKGFRYAMILPDGGAELLDAKVLVRHYPMDEDACRLEADDPLLEQIFTICKNGVRYGTQEGYLDCPTREKGQYLGDALVTGNAQVWLTGNTDMLRKCIWQFAYTREICPGLMAVAPGSYMQEIADFSLLWSQLLLLDYKFTGDKEFLKGLYPVAKGIIHYFSRYAREDGLLEQVAEKWNLVDWPENLRDDYDFDLSRPVVAKGCHNVMNALYIGAVKTLSQLERIIGIPESLDWRALKAAYIRALYHPDQERFTDSESSTHSALHSCLYALYFGIAPEGKEQKLADFMLKKGLCCGVYTSYFYLKSLALAGRYGDIYHLLLNDSTHGWVNMLREGATTCWEAWGKDQKHNASLCHPWASAPISILIEDLAGFCPDPQMPDGFRFEPNLPDELSNFRLKIPFHGKHYLIEKMGAETTLKQI